MLVGLPDGLSQHSQGTFDGPDVRFVPILFALSLLPFLVDVVKVVGHVILVDVFGWQSGRSFRSMNSEGLRYS